MTDNIKVTTDDELEHSIVSKLFSMRDEKYRDFNASLLPTIDKERIIGVRTPQLRALAKGIKKDGRSEELLKLSLPHYYFEMMNLHAFVIEQEGCFDNAIKLTEDFLPYIDNWATCDLFSPKVFKQNPERLIPYIKKWLKSNNTYTVRYAIVQLLSSYLDDSFDKIHLEWVASVDTDEYYIKMAIAWYFSMALAKQYEYALPYIIDHKLDKQIHNKTLQKAIESRQISSDTKVYLRTLRIK
ncbi:MAG: DNA alkylation repair protein [Ruminococcus sp.]|nr:DNA alkylation repair protein [Ruminococcus sp.]